MEINKIVCFTAKTYTSDFEDEYKIIKSSKNFCLFHTGNNDNSVFWKFAKIGKDKFMLKYKKPLNNFTALSIAISVFEN